MSTVRAVIAGAGLMGRWHAEAAVHAGAQVVGVVDLDLQRARAIAGDATVHAELATAPQQRPDVVHLCTPPGTHAALATAALEAGCHVLVEKPGTATPDEAVALAVLARSKGRLLVPVHQFRFQRGVQDILAARERLGRPRHVELTICSAGAEQPGADRDVIAAEISPHAFSLARALLASAVGGLDWQLARGAPGEWRFTAVTAEGCVLSNLISLSSRPTQASWRVLAEGGSAQADLFHGFSTFEPGTSARAYKVGRPLAVGLKGVAAASTNLALRALEGEVAYPGLRELVAATYAASSGGAAPFADDELTDVAAAVAKLRWR